jgi:hypothetical protein
VIDVAVAVLSDLYNRNVFPEPAVIVYVLIPDTLVNVRTDPYISDVITGSVTDPVVEVDKT